LTPAIQNLKSKIQNQKGGLMFSREAQRRSRQRRAARGATGARRLYSISAWPEQRVFSGTFSMGGAEYSFTYGPSRAENVDNKLRLTGRLTVTDARGRARTLDPVRATLANTQGGVGTAPARRQIATEAPPGVQATSQQKQQVAGETEKRSGEKEGGQAQAQKSALPATENTGPTSYCGVLYFHFEPLDARALRVPTDLSKVQLNVRLAPLDDTARSLHGLYCYVVDALYGGRTDDRLAAAAIAELNRVLSA
jgi:hypothetical protein